MFGGLMGYALMGGFSSSGNGYNSCDCNSFESRKIEKERLEEDKRKNDIEERRVFIDQISTASDDQILTMLQPKLILGETWCLSGGLDKRIVVDEVTYDKPKKEFHKYHDDILFEANKRGLEINHEEKY